MVAAVVYGGYAVGVALFHAQHSFEEGYVRRAAEWSFEDAAFKGSSRVVVPRCLKWAFMGIEYHHIHHYDPKVPVYRLQACHEDGDPAFWADVTIIGYGDWPRVLRTTRYDEARGKFT